MMFNRLPDVVRKSLLPLATGVVTFLLTKLADPNLGTGPTLLYSLLIPAAIAAGQFLIDVERRLKDLTDKLDDHHAAMMKLVEKRLADGSKAVELFGLLERASVDRGIIEKFLRYALDLDGTSPLLNRFAHSQIERVAEILQGLGRENLTYTGEDHEWLLTLTDSAQSTIYATSLSSVDDGLWTSDFGDRYLKSQEEALERGVRIRRVFVPGDAASLSSAEFRTVCRRQIALGIDVRVLRPADVPREAGPLTDFILLDHVVSYEVTPSFQPVHWSDQPTIAKTSVVLGAEALRKNADRFEVLWDAAEPPFVEEVPPPRHSPPGSPAPTDSTA
jgi:hypothetical protein